MSNHCRQIWPQVIYTSSKTADNTHSFSLPIPCRLCSSKGAQSDSKPHQKNAWNILLYSACRPLLLHFQINDSLILLNCLFLLLNIIFTLFYALLVTGGCPPTFGWQQALAKSHFVSCYINVTWRHIIYSSNCWHPNRALNGDTLILFLCAWATPVHMQREGGSQREANLMFFQKGRSNNEHIQGGHCCCFTQKALASVSNMSPAADTSPSSVGKCEQEISLQSSRKVPKANMVLVTNSGNQIAWLVCRGECTLLCVGDLYCPLYVLWVGANNR